VGSQPAPDEIGKAAINLIACSIAPKSKNGGTCSLPKARQAGFDRWNKFTVGAFQENFLDFSGQRNVPPSQSAFISSRGANRRGFTAGAHQTKPTADAGTLPQST
jgi:hypothetical protein